MRALGHDDPRFPTTPAARARLNGGVVPTPAPIATPAAERRTTRRLPQQGGDIWSIEPASLRRFILDHLGGLLEQPRARAH
jgi:hypothetical protein